MHTVKKLTEAQPESPQVHFIERAMDSPAPNLEPSGGHLCDQAAPHQALLRQVP